MKKLDFTHSRAQRLYDDYLKRISRMARQLPEADQQELLMEFNSHIYEGIQAHPEAGELETLVDVLDHLGAPEEVLKPLVADKKLAQATRTFHPVHIAKALALNLSNGLIYFVFSLLYLFLFAGVFMIGAKLFNPEEVGMYTSNGSFVLLGKVSSETLAQTGYEEILGPAFIPVILGAMVLFYIIITLLLKLKQRLKRR
ncbi:MAG TPA: hypothetical protein DCE41_33385 [Cytophagales bacterium]|nr:hypothetical protein [Cytophagales bacterium]HAA18962.1 hypothetical protein [Cytophagales bacterium]HAP65054.1 hypothetical protein [Cytophagales bacterium]